MTPSTRSPGNYAPPSHQYPLATQEAAGAVLWTVIGSGVLILAGLTIITIIGVIRHRARNSP